MEPPSPVPRWTGTTQRPTHNQEPPGEGACPDWHRVPRQPQARACRKEVLSGAVAALVGGDTQRLRDGGQLDSRQRWGQHLATHGGPCQVAPGRAKGGHLAGGGEEGCWEQGSGGREGRRCGAYTILSLEAGATGEGRGARGGRPGVCLQHRWADRRLSPEPPSPWQAVEHRIREEQRAMDQKIVLELDRKVADQQSTLEKAGVAGFYVTTNPQVSAVGLAWHSLGATGPQRPHPLWGSSWSLRGLCCQRTSQLPAGHRPPCSGLLCPTGPSSAVPCIPAHLHVCQTRAAANAAVGRVPASAPFWQAVARLPPRAPYLVPPRP